MSEKPLPPGLWWYNPFGEDITEINVQTRQAAGSANGYTKDIQSGSFAYAVSYRINAADVASVYSQVGPQWEQRLLFDLIPDVIKNVIGQWEATDLIANRSKLTPQIVSQLSERVLAKCQLAGIPTDSVEIVGFALTNIDFSDEFERAVEAKVTAVQKAEQEKNRTVQIQEQAKQTIITAQADAESMRIRSQALAQNQNLVQWEAVKKWNGVLPVQMLGNAPVPFVDVGTAR